MQPRTIQLNGLRQLTLDMFTPRTNQYCPKREKKQCSHGRYNCADNIEEQGKGELFRKIEIFTSQCRSGAPIQGSPENINSGGGEGVHACIQLCTTDFN